MQIISTFLFAAAVNLDSFVVGLSYGARQVHIRFGANLLIALIIFAGTLLSMMLGTGLKDLIPAVVAALLGSGMIVVFGLICLIGFFRRRGREAEEASLRSMELRELIPLACALAANNMGLGVGAGIAGLGLWATALASCLCSVLFLYCGNRLGKERLSGVIGAYAEPISGIMMIALGLYELLG